MHSFRFNMSIFSSLIILGFIVSSVCCSENRAHSSGASMDPFGIWSSTGGVLRKGIHMLRDNLQEGVKIAQMLKEDVAGGISHISPKKNQHSSHSNNKPVGGLKASAEDVGLLEEFLNSNKNKQREGMLGGILRFVGFDSNSIGIVVLNVLIFIAEMVTSSLLGKESNNISDRRELKTNILEFLTTGHNEKMDQIFEQAQNASLPENIIQLLQTKTGNKTSCVQLLLCKLKPFIWSVQKTVAEQLNSPKTTNDTNTLSEKYIISMWDQFNQVLPSKNNFISYGNNCETKYPVCQLLKFEEKRNSTLH